MPRLTRPSLLVAGDVWEGLRTRTPYGSVPARCIAHPIFLSGPDRVVDPQNEKSISAALRDRRRGFVPETKVPSSNKVSCSHSLTRSSCCFRAPSDPERAVSTRLQNPCRPVRSENHHHPRALSPGTARHHGPRSTPPPRRGIAAPGGGEQPLPWRARGRRSDRWAQARLRVGKRCDLSVKTERS